MSYLNQPWDEPIKACDTPAEMRVELHRMRWNDALVHQVLAHAEYTGVSAEDKYTVLSYNLLRALRGTQQRLLEQINTQPSFGVGGPCRPVGDLEGRN